MRCKFFSIYLAIKRLGMGKILKNRAKSKAPVIRTSKNLFDLLKLEDTNLNEAKINMGSNNLIYKNDNVKTFNKYRVK